jgi:hypothetical protein
MNIPDSYDLWEDHDREQAKRLEQLPKCDYCNKPIQDEHLFDICGDVFCERCVIRNFRKDTEDYVS